MVSLSEKGKNHVPLIEKMLKKRMRHLIQGVKFQELYDYLRVLQAIIKNNDTPK